VHVPRTRKTELPINVVPLVRRSPALNAPKLTVPRRAKVNSARIDFPLLEGDLERLQTNACAGMMAFKMVIDQIELLRVTERRDGMNEYARHTLLAQIYTGLNRASRMMNPYRRPRG
jgi:hypothetical protein